MSALDPLETALEPWRGEWFAPVPNDEGPRFFSLEEFTAKQLLARGSRLSNWQARLCQQVITQGRPASGMQAHLLGKIARETEVEARWSA